MVAWDTGVSLLLKRSMLCVINHTEIAAAVVNERA